MKPRVLLIDDDPRLRDAYTEVLDEEFHLWTAVTGEEGLAVAVHEDVDVVILDLLIPGLDGLTVLDHLQTLDPHVAVLIVTALDTARGAVAALQAGAVDYLVKPVAPVVLLTRLRQLVTTRRAWQGSRHHAGRAANAPQRILLLGQSRPMRQLRIQMHQIAAIPATVLITGETGVGKDLVAQGLHQQSPRRQGPFIAVNCAALPPTLAASALFGHERGAFTDAERRHLGQVEQAQHGTLFFDEVGSLPFEVQGLLLRFLQERTFERVGGETRLAADVRVVAATNQDLQRMIAAQTFRQDLFYRLHVLPLDVPPLRARREDIPLLVQHFLRQYSLQYARPQPRLDLEALHLLQQYDWPGNVRELEHCLARCVVTSDQPILDAAAVRIALALEPAASPWRRSLSDPDIVALGREREESLSKRGMS
jgi:DNA-binding NtrC family response regulator